MLQSLWHRFLKCDLHNHEESECSTYNGHVILAWSMLCPRGMYGLGLHSCHSYLRYAMVPLFSSLHTNAEACLLKHFHLSPTLLLLKSIFQLVAMCEMCYWLQKRNHTLRNRVREVQNMGRLIVLYYLLCLSLATFTVRAQSSADSSNVNVANVPDCAVRSP